MKNKLIFLSIFLIFTFAVIIVTDLTLGNYIEISSIIGINVPITCKIEAQVYTVKILRLKEFLFLSEHAFNHIYDKIKT